MTGAELIGCVVYDAAGTPLGRVHDLRFAASGPAYGQSGSPAYRLTALECGGAGMVHRLGYSAGAIRGPWPLTLLMRWLVRRSVVVPYSAVTRVADRRVEIGLRRDELRPTGEDQL